MINAYLPLILDGAVIILLAATMFFAARLSLHLRDFRSGKRDLEKLISDLSGQIIRAERSVAGMREAARESGRDLQAMINEAKALAEELQFIEESGNSLASRLEALAEKSGRVARATQIESPVQAVRRAEKSGFAIRDPDAGAGQEEDDRLFSEPEYEDADTGRLESRAEKELFEALRGSKRKAGAGGVS